MLLLICSTRRFTIASDGRVEKSKKEKKKLYLEKSAGALEWNRTYRQFFFLLHEDQSKKVIKQVTSIEYSLVISRPPDGQVHWKFQIVKEFFS